MDVKRSVRILVGSICVTGLLLPAFLGVIIRTYLLIKGGHVVSWSIGIAWGIPLTILFLFPFILLALLTYFVLSRINPDRTILFLKLWYTFIGALVGIVLVHSYMLSQLMLDSFEDLIHVVIFSPLINPIILLYSLGGAFVGISIGWFIGGKPNELDKKLDDEIKYNEQKKKGYKIVSKYLTNPIHTEDYLASHSILKEQLESDISTGKRKAYIYKQHIYIESDG